MSYEAAEAEVQTLLKTLTGFSTAVYLDDATPANKGVAKFIVLEYAGFYQRPESFNAFEQITWTCNIHLCVRHQNAAQVRNDLRDNRQDIIELLNKHPRLAGTAFDAFLVRGFKNNEDIVMGQVRFIKETLVLEITEAYEQVAED